MWKSRAIGKQLVYLLRHAPYDAGVKPDKGGWVNIPDLLRNTNIGISDFYASVANEKRLDLSSDGLKVRATHGHTYPVVLGLPPCQPPQELYHGTTDQALKGIYKEALTRQSRNHVHLCEGAATAQINGRRRYNQGVTVVLAVDALRMYQLGYNFYNPSPGVWLTDIVLPEYLRIICAG